MSKILVSACLAGIKCNYRGRSRTNKKVLELVERNIAIPVCPEVLGGLLIPRKAAWILSKNENYDGDDVLDKKTIVIDESGKDVTENFINGAYKVLEIVKQHDIKLAYLNQYSPSCGHGRTLGGDECCRKYIRGDGVTTALLKRNGVRILTKNEFEKFYDQEMCYLKRTSKKLEDFFNSYKNKLTR